jgi:hypothetical protein
MKKRLFTCVFSLSLTILIVIVSDFANAAIINIPDLSALTNLKHLSCGDNDLTSLPDLSGLSNLQTLSCSYNYPTRPTGTSW